MTKPLPLHLPPLAPYEDRLLRALAFFRTHRQVETQAHHCLSMYLRQSEARVMGEVKFYAELIGLSTSELLTLIAEDPETALAALEVYGDIAPVAEENPPA